MRVCFNIVVFMALPSLIGGTKSYAGYQVVRAHLHRPSDWVAVREIVDGYPSQMELWNHPDGSTPTVDIQVVPGGFLTLTKHLRKHNIHHTTFIKDIQRLIEHGLPDIKRVRRSADNSTESNPDEPSRFPSIVGTYATFDQIEAWLRRVESEYSEIVTLKTIGSTHEGNPLYVLKLGTQKEGKRAIYLDFGMHAREWISPASGIYIINQLITGYKRKDHYAMDLLQKLYWYIVPVANPDGYKYSHEKDRLWRKNRSPNFNSSCYGTDLNRNWPFHWGEVLSSSNPCSNFHHGPYNGSELETQALMAFFLENKQTIHAFLSVHSYLQLFLSRWAYTNNTINDNDEMMYTARRAVKAMIYSSGTNYRVGRAFELLYAYSGGSADWVKAVAEIKYSYTVELRDRGYFGFLLPTNYVMPVGQELWQGVKVVARQVIAETWRDRFKESTSSTSNLSTFTDHFRKYFTLWTVITFLKCFACMGLITF